MVLLAVLMLLVCLGLPLAQALKVWRLDESNRAAWLLRAGEASVFTALVFLLGRWDMAGYWFRPLLALLFLAALLRSWQRHRHRPWRGSAGFWRRQSATALALALFSAALLVVLWGRLPPADAQQLAFPLQEGRFVVGQGGGNVLLNHHAGHPAQRYAADITALYADGFRAHWLLPGELERYAIFGTPVVSPCAGTVESVQDGLPDLVPPQADPDHPAGNHAVLRCGGLRVELAHLREGSLQVHAGDAVQPGTPLGVVGNSGNTSEPHLHIHASDAATGEGVPLRFEEGHPYRNRLFSR